MSLDVTPSDGNIRCDATEIEPRQSVVSYIVVYITNVRRLPMSLVLAWVREPCVVSVTCIGGFTGEKPAVL
jgi:hypothetical protein